jgi:hypothetical protein
MATLTEPRFIEVKPAPTQGAATFIENQPQRGGWESALHEEQLTAMGSFLITINFSHLGTDHLRSR